MSPLAVWWTLLPTRVPAPPPGGAPGSERGEEFGKTSPIALVVILLLGLATALLIRSMTKRLRNVPASFDPPEEDARADRPEQGDDPDGEGHPAAGRGGTDRADPAGGRPPGAGSP
ncbi:hypothetical protein PHK61_04595 [Actinomycetospora lutea]|uniref:hypothetical protein n=1 Tax=Actinomycetospora lutea TaxID=663604 RepID=UPI00236626D8|nr:hypothetical protein [Actinomycetospora lutea]MDD7937698.1 hypothetical protein [Actinomycetospora lutea]